MTRYDIALEKSISKEEKKLQERCELDPKRSLLIIDDGKEFGIGMPSPQNLLEI